MKEEDSSMENSARTDFIVRVLIIPAISLMIFCLPLFAGAQDSESFSNSVLLKQNVIVKAIKPTSKWKEPPSGYFKYPGEKIGYTKVSEYYKVLEIRELPYLFSNLTWFKIQKLSKSDIEKMKKAIEKLKAIIEQLNTTIKKSHITKKKLKITDIVKEFTKDLKIGEPKQMGAMRKSKTDASVGWIYVGDRASIGHKFNVYNANSLREHGGAS